MIQTQRIAIVAQTAGITHEQAETALRALYGSIGTDLCKGERVRMPGIGSLVAVPVAAHPGRNPRTGESIDVPAHRKIRFRTSAALTTGLAETPTKAAAE